MLEIASMLLIRGRGLRGDMFKFQVGDKIENEGGTKFIIIWKIGDMEICTIFFFLWHPHGYGRLLEKEYVEMYFELFKG